MPAKPHRWMLWAGIIIVLLLSAVIVSVTFILPTYVENRIIPGLAHELSLTPDQIRVRRIGLWGTDLGPFRFSAHNTPAISMTTLQIDYSPLSLLQGRIEGITLVGLDLGISVTPEGISIAGLTQKKSTANTEKAAIDLRTLLPIRLDRLSILKSQVVIDLSDRRHTIPFELELQTEQLENGHLEGRTQLAIAGHPMTVIGSIDQTANQAKIHFEIPRFLLSSLYGLGRIPSQINASGEMKLSGRGTIELQPLKLTDFSVSGQLRDTRIATSNGTLQNLSTAQGDSTPILFSMDDKGPGRYQWNISSFLINSLLDVTVKRSNGELVYTDGLWSMNSDIRTLIEKQPLPAGGMLETDLILDWQMTARSRTSGEVEFDLTGHTDKPWKATMADGILSGQKERIRFNGQLKNNTLYAKGKISAEGLLARLPAGKIRVPRLDVVGTLAIPSSGTAASASITAQATAPDVRTELKTTSVLIPKITLKANGSSGRAAQAPWQFDARVNIVKGRIVDPSYGVRMTNLTMDIPLKWPDASGVESGRVKISAIKWKNRQMGGIHGTLRQADHGVSLNIRHASKLFPGLRVLFDGNIDASGAQINARMPSYHMADEIDLGQFVPQAAGFQIKGKAAASGKLTADVTGIRASGQFEFNKGRLHEESRKLVLEDIDMTIQMDDLLQMKSAPRQRLRIDLLSLGNLKAHGLDIDFQIEDPKTLFIEKSGINWSEGKINASSIRIISGHEDYDVTLFCDRLNLAMVLEQLRAAQAQGEGTVSGRIPVRWTEGRLSFDNGFLYSTPGQSGSIKIHDTQMLLAGLPPGSPQHTQLDIATEALKDYTYKWAKLNVLSEEETLLLKLQLDGKPNKLLPFAYNQSLGQFKRVKGEGQADFKGISIDLNFRSPLNDIINYKELLKQQN